MISLYYRSCVYLGLWSDDKYHGYGVLIDNGKIYEGHFDSGEKRVCYNFILYYYI